MQGHASEQSFDVRIGDGYRAVFEKRAYPSGPDVTCSGCSQPAQIISAKLDSGVASDRDLATLKETEAARRELAEVRRLHTLAEKKYENLEEPA